jgi:hypothetical protein
MSRRYVTKEDNILHDENNLVHLHCADGEVYESLEPRRLFPINRPNEYITLLDKEGKEIAVIRSIEQINEDSRRVIHDSLEDYYLVPEITRIVNTIEKYGRLHWIVETDRGRKEFDIRNRNSDIRISPNGRVRVRDADDNRYTIHNWRDLDKHSRSLLIADL